AKTRGTAFGRDLRSTRATNSSDPAAVRPTRAVALAQVLLATPSNLLLLARRAKLARLLLRALVALCDLLLERGERGVGRRSSGPGLLSLVRHERRTPRRSLRRLGHWTNARARHRA